MSECDRLEQDIRSLSLSLFPSQSRKQHDTHNKNNTSLWTWRWHSNVGTHKDKQGEKKGNEMKMLLWINVEKGERGREEAELVHPLITVNE